MKPTHKKDITIGFNLYEIKRPSTSPTRPARPRGPVAPPTNAPRRAASPAIAAAPTTGRLRPLVRASAPPQALSSAQQENASDSQLSTSPMPPPTNCVETLLQYLIPVDTQLLDPAMTRTVTKVLENLRKRRRQRKGSKPVLRRSLGSGESLDFVTQCLVEACEAPSIAAAMEKLSSCWTAHASADIQPLPSLHLISSALVELRFLSDPPEHVQESLAMLDSALSSGHPAAMLRVGLCLRHGTGVDADLAAALTWIEGAASNGYVPAMHELGCLYESGAVVGTATLESDWGEAMRWYSRAASEAYVASQLNLGKLLLSAAEEHRASSVSSAADLAGLKLRARESLEQAASSGCEEAVRLLRRL